MDVGIEKLPATRAAFIRHLGQYMEVGPTWERLRAVGRGRELAHAPCVEFYRNDPRTTPPAELVTDVGLPLAPR